MSGLEVTRTNNKRIQVSIPLINGKHHISVDQILWFARELEKAVQEGLPKSVQVNVREATLSVDHVIIQEIP